MKRNYSKVIEELRTIHGLNLVAIGQRIGIDPRTVGKWQAGKHKPNKDSRKKINALYREVRKDMTTQVSIFEDDNKQIMQVVTTKEFNGHPLEVYGDIEEPLFLARAVAEMIDYSKTSQGYYNTAQMLKAVDEDEKLKAFGSIKIVNSRPNKNSNAPSVPMWFLTEQGLYEVLFQSRKPIAKEFKKWVKQILKEIRQQGYYMAGELIDEPKTSQTPDHNAYINQLLQRAIDETDLTKKYKRIQEVYCTANVIEQIETGVGRKFEPLYKD
ncbi:BRO family protein [Streptococcus danieliae]|uniref:BRO family protein n=1 Tax=Streptococcus danieliae TaxID=747656 RepID=UPI0026EF7FDE|nr:BRO family protein [Streptococcus danieliae]